MITESYVSVVPAPTEQRPSGQRNEHQTDATNRRSTSVVRIDSRKSSIALNGMRPVSWWTRSGLKRAFDCLCVVVMLPLLVPMAIVIWLAVRFTSDGPVLFLQKRMGRNGREFTILKFRTMVHCEKRSHNPVTTSGNQRFTPVGPFLRRSKLDELPQLLNILAGNMSLVGPRPKLPQHAITDLNCRPGITGSATVAFALEEAILERVPKVHLDSFYHSVVLPAKHRLDEEYMARATFSSDLKLIVDSVLRKWNCDIMEELLSEWAHKQDDSRIVNSVRGEVTYIHPAILPQMDRPAASSQASSY